MMFSLIYRSKKKMRYVKDFNTRLLETKVYGHAEIKKLETKLKDDEHIYLDDSSGQLSGEIVSKPEYITRILQDALQKKDWSKIESLLTFVKVHYHK
jgi:hypothetical protein